MMAIFESTAPSKELSVEARGWVTPCGHKVRNPRPPGGTTVAFRTKAWAVRGIPQGLPPTLTSGLFCPVKAGLPCGRRVSSTRHRVTLNSDNPPFPGGAKYPFTSMTKSVLLVENTDTPPFPVPTGTMAALATAALDGAFRVEANGCGCPVGHAVRKPMPAFVGTAVIFKE